MIYTIKNQYLTVNFNSIGAELTELKSADKNYIWNIDLQFWNKTSPILFPVVGKLKDESYFYNNKKYSLPRHGFARNFEFKVVEMSDSRIVFSLSSNDETKSVYPFEFELQIGYFLIENELKIQYKVINKTEIEMPFSIGAHPAFSLPNNFNNYCLEFEKQETLYNYSLRNELITNDFEVIELDNKLLQLNYSLFENDALIFKQIESKKVTILENLKPILSVNYKGFPSLGIWTKINAPFLCIEPWFGYADSENSSENILEKNGILILKTNEIFNSEYSIEILE